MPDECILHPVSWRHLILSNLICPSYALPSAPPPPFLPCMSRSSYPSLFDYANLIQTAVSILKLLVMLFSSDRCYHLPPNIVPSNLFSITLGLHPSLNAWGRVSLPYKTGTKIIVCNKNSSNKKNSYSLTDRKMIDFVLIVSICSPNFTCPEFLRECCLIS